MDHPKIQNLETRHFQSVSKHMSSTVDQVADRSTVVGALGHARLRRMKSLESHQLPFDLAESRRISPASSVTERPESIAMRPSSTFSTHRAETLPDEQPAEESDLKRMESTSSDVDLVTSSIVDSDVHMNIGVFVKEFLYHVFFPLSYPFILMIDGRIYTQNHGWMFTTLVPLDLLIGCLMGAINIVYFGYLVRGSTGITGMEIAMANCSYILHKLMVATKYAFYTDEHMEELHQVPLSPDLLADRELIGGWLNLSPDSCLRELDSAGHRIGVNLQEIHFHLNYSKDEIDSFYARAVQQLPPADVDDTMYPKITTSCVNPRLSMVTVFDQLRHIVSIVFSRKAKISRRILIISGLLAALSVFSPMVIRKFCPTSCGDPSIGKSSGKQCAFVYCTAIPTPDWPAGDMFVQCACIIISQFFITVSYTFISVGIVDYLRRAKLMAMLQVMVDPSPLAQHLQSDLAFSFIKCQELFFDISIAENLVSWFVSRQVMHQFGLAFRRRITWFITMLFAEALLLIIILVVDFINYTPRSGMSPHELVLLWTGGLVFCSTLCWLSVMIYFGAKGNDAFWYHRGTLSRVQMTLREHMAQLDSRRALAVTLVESQSLENVDALMDSIAEMIATEGVTDPVTVVSIRASTSLLTVFVTIFSLVITYAIHLFTGIGA